MIDWIDVAEHCAGAAAIMAVFIAGAIAVGNRFYSVMAGFAVNLAYWPWREIDQHGLRWPWHYGIGSLAEMTAPVAVALLGAAIGFAAFRALDL